MPNDPFSDENLPAPWRAAGKHAPALERELRKEIGPDHVLYGRRVMAVARRGDGDDVLFVVDAPAFPLAVVRLDWTQGGVPRPPETRQFSSVEAWVAWAQAGSGLS